MPPRWAAPLDGRPRWDAESFGYDSDVSAGQVLFTLANALSAVRLACVPACAWAILAGEAQLAAGAFVLAVVTDMADGPVARRRGEASALGGLIDHGVDALFCITAIAALAANGLAPTILPVLIAAAFLQYMADSRALAGRPLRASRLGRYNGIAYYALVGIPVARDGLGLAWPVDALVVGLGWLLAATTAASMWNRLRARLGR